jgi:hypothetical protein
MGPEPITLTRVLCFGQANNAEGQALTPFEADVVNSLTEKQLENSRICQHNGNKKKSLKNYVSWKCQPNTKRDIEPCWQNTMKFSV